MTVSNKLPREFYTRSNTLQIARELLGKLLVVVEEDAPRVAGMIVETEGYKGPLDKASHAFGHRRTARTETMYGLGGTAYVYFIYGMYCQFNVVTNEAETPHAILVRALEPVEGIDVMHQRRTVKTDRDLSNGPGKLCIAMNIDRRFDRADLLGEEIWIEDYEKIKPRQIASGPRVGISYAEDYVDKPWRFWIKDNPCVSRK
jgi:DNA-3-methyladenine glycosylase